MRLPLQSLLTCPPSTQGPGSVEGPPLVTGVVYRVREGSLVVAVDEAPEEGMDQPLRLDKLANEVRVCISGRV